MQSLIVTVIQDEQRDFEKKVRHKSKIGSRKDKPSAISVYLSYNLRAAAFCKTLWQAS